MHIGQTALRRRAFLQATIVGAALACTPTQYAKLLAGPVTRGPGPYGELLGPNDDGLLLPKGFRSRVVAVAGEVVRGVDANGHPAPLDHVWHAAPDGAACFPTGDGGFRYVCNAEVGFAEGGVSGIRFDADGNAVDAYPVLEGTSRNCAGGVTPWGTWLSCEEAGDQGRVWECPPDGSWPGEPLPMLGWCNHEAVAVDPVNQYLFLTEDLPDGLFYRWVMADGRFDQAMANGRLRADGPDDGVLQAARVAEDGMVEWVDIDDPAATPLREAVDATPFNGAEGIWYDSGFVYFTTKGNDRVWVHDVAGGTITVLYDAEEQPDAGLRGVDNLTIAPSGDVLVAEDGDDLEIRVITADTREVVPLVRLPGPEHDGSEITGPCFSPDGTRLFFSSQRGGVDGPGEGITYEVTGPFRTERVGIAATGGAPDLLDPAPHSPATPGANRLDLA